MERSESRWATSFLMAAIVQGAIAAVITFIAAAPGLLRPEVSRVIAGGGAGTWFTVGYTIYITVGVVAMAVTALFYHYLEIVLKKPYAGKLRILAGLHLILMNVGVAGASILAMYGGYLGGAAAQPTQLGGKGWNPGQVHENILKYYPEPIFAFLVLALLGIVVGGLGYILAYRRK